MINKLKKTFGSTKVALSCLGVAVLILVASVCLVVSNNKEQERLRNLPIKVDISMNSWFGDIETILYELNLDFEQVTMGANCINGTQKNSFRTEKFGILYTEFRYCKTDKTRRFRVYNDERDQELREPKQGELSTFNYYGDKEFNN